MAFFIGSKGVEGTLWTWGINTVGALGLGDTNHRSSPVQIGSLTNWKELKSENLSSLAIKTDGTLWAWGNNGFGQLGLGDAVPRSSPLQVGNLTDWKSTSNPSLSSLLAVKTDGTLWASGYNSGGGLGLGDVTNRSSPVQVGNLTNWKEVSINSGSSYAIKTDGTLWAWGINSSGQLGHGDIVDRSSPVQVGNLTNWKEVSAGNTHVTAIKTDGTLWAWGINSSGQLGISNTTARSSPVQVGNLTIWKNIINNGSGSFAIKTDGTLWAWGSGTNGQLGLGDITNRSSPVQVGNNKTWRQINSRNDGIFAVRANGTLWAWGYNGNGELGLGDITSRSSPVQVGILTDWCHPAAYLLDTEVSIGIKKSVAKINTKKYLDITNITWEELHRISSGELWTWGDNTNGRLGLGDITNRSSPVQVGLADYWKSYVDGNNKAYTWGNNNNGQLGHGNITHRSSPVQVGSLTNWKQVVVIQTSGYSTAIKTDGTLWSWGSGTAGKLGHNAVTFRSSPVQVGSLNNWKTVSPSDGHCLAIKTDGTLWAWGANSNGNLGLGDIVNRSSPVQVGNLTDWKTIGLLLANSSTAVKTDGTLWAWGSNSVGQLGLGDITNRSSPVQVGNLTNWKSTLLANNGALLAIKTDGTLWAWGGNTEGQLGLGDIIDRSSPVQVGSLTNWKYIGINRTTSIVAIKTDGTLWSWGSNTNGELGLSDVIPRSSPVQVGSFTDWKEITPNGAIRYGIE